MPAHELGSRPAPAVHLFMSTNLFEPGAAVFVLYVYLGPSCECATVESTVLRAHRRKRTRKNVYTLSTQDMDAATRCLSVRMMFPLLLLRPRAYTK